MRPRLVLAALLLLVLSASGRLRADEEPVPAETAPPEGAVATATPQETTPATPVEATLPEGEFPPRVFVAKQDGVPVRAEPGFVYREINHLAKGKEILVDGRKGTWLHVRPEGWVMIEHVEEPELVGGPIRLVVQKEGARVRSGPGTDQAPLRTVEKGTKLEAIDQESGWWKLADGGWIFKDVVAFAEDSSTSPAFDGPPAEGAVPTGKNDFKTAFTDMRWSLMDMHGIVFEISPISPRSPFIPLLKREMKDTNLLTEDWTFLRIVISVPQGLYRFNYSPDSNATVMVDPSGERYGSVWLRGNVERLPADLRTLFTPATVNQGETWAGIVIFRPTLDPAKVRDVFLFIGGRYQKLYRSS